MIEENKNRAQSGIEALRKIGVEKIKKDTHLDIGKIVDILEKRFDRLDYVRAKGFIYILEKKYDLDLSEWLEEYHGVYPQIDDQQEKKEPDSNKASNKKSVFYLALVVCIALGMSLKLFLSEDLSPSQEKVQNPSDISKESRAEVFDLSLEQGEISSKQEGDQEKDEKLENQADKKVELPLLTTMNNLGKPVFEVQDLDFDSILHLEFVKPIWVGVIDFDSKRRIGRTKKEFDIPLDKELLIYIAYGSFIATSNENRREFKTYQPIFLIFSKEEGLRQITKEEFIALNGGMEW